MLAPPAILVLMASSTIAHESRLDPVSGLPGTHATVSATGVPGAPVAVPFLAEARAHTWRVRLVEVLHLMTSLALALFYLVPACSLVAGGVWFSMVFSCLESVLKESGEGCWPGFNCPAWRRACPPAPARSGRRTRPRAGRR